MSSCPRNVYASAYFYDGKKEIKTPFQFELFAANPRTWGLAIKHEYAIDQFRPWAKNQNLIENGDKIICNVESEHKVIFAAIPKECKLINTNFKNNNKNKNKNKNNSRKKLKNRENELDGLFNKNSKLSKREKELKNLFKGGKTRRKSRKTKKMFFGLF